MGRPAKLTTDQLAEIERRLLEGEPYSKLAAEFGVTKAALVNRFSKRTQTTKSVANQIVAAKTALGKLPLGQQIQAETLASRMMRTAECLASGSEKAAGTFMRLSHIANSAIEKIDDANPLAPESIVALKTAQMMTKAANEAAEIPIRLLGAARKALEEEGRDPETKADIIEIRGGLPVD